MTSILKLTLLKLYHSALVAPVFATASLFIKPLREIAENHADFFTILTLAILIDFIIGILKYVQLHKFSFKHMLVGLIVKIAVGFGGMLLFVAFLTLETGNVSDWFLTVAKFTVLLYPAGSAFANMFVITNGKFPPISFLKRLDTFDKIITPSALSLEEDEKNKSKQ